MWPQLITVSQSQTLVEASFPGLSAAWRTWERGYISQSYGKLILWKVDLMEVDLMGINQASVI